MVSRPFIMKRRILSVICAGILTFTSLVPVASVSATPNNVQEARDKYLELETKVQEINEKIQTLDSEMSLLDEKINENKNKITDINKEIEKTKDEIGQVKKTINEKEEILGDRVREIYKSGGQTDIISLIFSAESFSDLITKIDSASRIVKLDQKIVDEVVEQKEKLDNKVEKLDEKSNEISTLNEAIEKQSEEVKSKKSEQEKLISEAKAEQSKFDEEYLSKMELELIEDKLRICNSSNSSLEELKTISSQLKSIRDAQIKSPTVISKINSALDVASANIDQKQEEANLLAQQQAANSSLVNRGEVSASSNATINAIINEAYKHLGKPYVYGAKGPNTFDCSGFTSYVYRAVMGIEIGGSTYSQINSGIEVSYSELQPGDLVFPHAGHVGIYIGNGQMIHAPQTGDVVKVAPVYKFWRARRIIY